MLLFLDLRRSQLALFSRQLLFPELFLLVHCLALLLHLLFLLLDLIELDALVFVGSMRIVHFPACVRLLFDSLIIEVFDFLLYSV